MTRLDVVRSPWGTLQYTRLGRTSGVIVDGSSPDELLSLGTDDIRRLLLDREGGAVLFRGFNLDRAAFKRFSETHGTNFVVSHKLEARDYVDQDLTFATVNKGRYAIDFHCEMAMQPLAPEVLWLFCEAPAARRGRTGVADGVAVLEGLSTATRSLFTDKRLMFEHVNVPPAMWRTLLQGADRRQAEAFLSTVGAARGVETFAFDEWDRLTFTYGYFAIRSARLSTFDVFCCGLLDSRGEYLFSDRSKVPHAALIDVIQATYQNAVWVDWQPGDCLVLDNTRVMHAREAFDSDRRMFVRYSDLRETATGGSAVAAV